MPDDELTVAGLANLLMETTTDGVLKTKLRQFLAGEDPVKPETADVKNIDIEGEKPGAGTTIAEEEETKKEEEASEVEGGDAGGEDGGEES